MTTFSFHTTALAVVVVSVAIVSIVTRPRIAARSAPADAADSPVAVAYSSVGDLFVAMSVDAAEEGRIERVSRDCVPILSWRTATPIDLCVSSGDPTALWALEAWPAAPEGRRRLVKYNIAGKRLSSFSVSASARYIASSRVGQTADPGLFVVHMPDGNRPAELAVYSEAGARMQDWDLPGVPRGLAVSSSGSTDRPVYVIVTGQVDRTGALLKYSISGDLVWEKPLDVTPVALYTSSRLAEIIAVSPSAPDGLRHMIHINWEAEKLREWPLDGITPVDLTRDWILGYLSGEPYLPVLHSYRYDGTLLSSCDRFGQAPVPTPEGTVVCPEPTPGSEAWRYETSGFVKRVPAVADDGTMYAATSKGLLYAIDCTGRRKWMFDYRLESPDYLGAQAFEGAPAVDHDGTIFIGDDVVVPNYFFAIDTHGRSKWVRRFENTYSQIDASPALAADGRIYTAAHGWGAGVSSGSVLILDREGNIHRPSGWAREDGVGPIRNSPALLADGSAAYVSPPFNEWVMPTGTQPTTTPWATRTLTPTGTRPTRTPAATNTPTPTRTRVSVTPRPTRSPTPTITTPAPEPFVAYLPAVASGTTSATSVGEQLHARPQQPLPYPYVTQPVPSRLRLVSGEIEADIVLDLDGMTSASSPAVHGNDIWFTAIAHDGAHMLAYRAGDPPELRFDRKISAGVASAPILGRTDPSAGTLAVYLLGTDGYLICIDASADTGASSVRWWFEVGTPADGAPVLGDDGRVYAAAGQAVVAINRESGEPDWTMRLDSPVSGSLNLASGGMLYVPLKSGEVLAVGTGSGGLDPEAAWPALRHDGKNTGSSSTTP